MIRIQARRVREIADQRIHGTTHERPADRFLREEPSLVPLMGIPPYRVLRRMHRRVSLDARVQVETNRYSVPWELAGQLVGTEVEGEHLTVSWQGQIVARHRLLPGRHQDLVDPSHLEGLIRRTYPAQDSEGVVRSLDAYAKVAGGDAW